MNSRATEGGFGKTSAAAVLHDALSVARENQRISDFLFDNLLENIFHKDYTLAPAALATSSMIQIKQTSQLDPLSAPNMCPAWVNTWLNGIITTNVNILYVPVVSAPPHTFGYAWFAKVPNNPPCFPASPFAPPCISRYTFDTTTGKLLHITHGGTPHCIGIFTIQTGIGCDCPQIVLGVPAVPYEWPYLPTLALWVMSSMEACQLRTTPHTSSSLQKINSDSRHVMFNQIPRHGNIIQDRDNSHLSVLGQAPRDDRVQSITNRKPVDKCTPSALRAALSNMVSLMSGCFEFSGFRFNEIMASRSATRMPAALFGLCNMFISTGNTADSVRIREHFAFICYRTALSATTDRPLLAMPASTPVQTTQYHDLVSNKPITLHCGTSIQKDDPTCNTISAGTVEELLDPLYNSTSLLDQLQSPLGSNRNYHLDREFVNEMAHCTTQDNDDNLDIKTERGNIIGAGDKNSNDGTDTNATQNFNRTYCRAVATVTNGTAPITTHHQLSAIPRSPHLRGNSHHDIWMTQSRNLGWNFPQHGNKSISQGHVAPARQCFIPLAPRADAQVISEHDPKESTPHTPRGSVDGQKRQNLIEARQKRNRLSAARSNERKRQLVADLQREVVEEKRKVVELSARKAMIQTENEQLRARIQLRPKPS